MLLAITESQWETSWFEVKFQTQASTKIPLESSHQGLSISVIQIWWFLCQIIQSYYDQLTAENFPGETDLVTQPTPD
jgi:hypothetical protein